VQEHHLIKMTYQLCW